MSDPVLLAQAVAAGVFDREVRDWLQAAFREWAELEAEDTLQASLNLPTTPEAFRRAVRDRYLREAIALLPEELSDWEAARTMAAAVKLFLEGEFEVWRRYPHAPPGAARLLVALHAAARSGAEMPLTPQAYWRLTRNRKVVSNRPAKLESSHRERTAHVPKQNDQRAERALKLQARHPTAST